MKIKLNHFSLPTRTCIFALGHSRVCCSNAKKVCERYISRLCPDECLEKFFGCIRMRYEGKFYIDIMDVQGGAKDPDDQTQTCKRVFRAPFLQTKAILTKLTRN